MKPASAPALLFASVALALAGCAESGPNSPPQGGSQEASPSAVIATNATTGCTVSVENTWIDQETPLRLYTAEAHTFGPTCEQSIAVLVIRAREGSPLFTWSGRVQDLFGLKDAADAASMKPALEDWISNLGGIATTAGLPEWETTDGQSSRAEFPFMPESWIDKTYWDTLKSENLDMFCFPQGGESLSCAVLRDGQMEQIGLQLFPG